MRMIVVVIAPPVHIVAVETAQDQVEPGRAVRNAEVQRDRDPVARGAVVVPVHDVRKAVAGPVGQFGPEEDVARRESAAQVAPDRRTADPVVAGDLLHETIFVLVGVVVDVESVTVDIVFVIAVIIRIDIEIEVDIDMLRRSAGRDGHSRQ